MKKNSKFEEIGFNKDVDPSGLWMKWQGDLAETGSR